MGKGQAYDVSSNGFSKHLSSQHVGGESTGADVVQALQVNGTLEFVTLFIALGAFIFFKPCLDCATEFYLKCFKRSCYWAPPKRYVFTIVDFFMDVSLFIALLHYLYTRRDPLPGSDTNWYVAIFSIFVAYLILRWWYLVSFWNFHNRAYALGFAIFFIILMLIFIIVLAILFAIRGDWWAFGFTIPVIIWDFLLLVWTITVYRKCVPRCARPCPEPEPACPLPEPVCPLTTGSRNRGTGVFKGQ